MQELSPRPRAGAAYRLLALGIAAVVAPLWMVEHLPMVDLPQHAAQVATWQRWGSAGFDYAALWEVNPRTPYLLPNGLAYLVSHLVGVREAFRLVVSLALAAIPLATLLLLRATRGSPSWVLASLPIGYGFAFHWGFVSYLLAVPVAIVFLALGWRYAEAPTPRRGLALWALAHLLFFCHVIAFGWGGLAVAAVVALRASGWRQRLVRWSPLLAALPLPVLWLLATRDREGRVHDPWVGGWSWERVPEAWSTLVGVERTPLAVLLGLALATLPLVLGGRPSRQPVRWVPFALTLGLFLAAPLDMFGTSFIYPRLGVLLLPAWLVALEPRRPPRIAAWVPAVLVLAVLADIAIGLRRFDAEVGDLDRLVASMAPDRRVLYLPVDRRSQATPAPVYLHSGQWYQVAKGGIVDFSFAEFFPNLFRYRPGEEPPLPEGIEWRAWQFDYHHHGGALYDYFLVHAPLEPTALVFSEAPEAVELEAVAEGGWWLYRRAPTGGSSFPRAEETPP